MATVGNPTSNIDSNNVPHDNTLDRQSASTLNTNDIQKQTIAPQKDSYKLDQNEHNRSIDALSHSPKLLITNFEEKPHYY